MRPGGHLRPGLPSRRFLLRVNPLPARAAKLILHPVEPRLRVGRIDRPQGQVVEVADNAIVSASVIERLIQASSRRVTEDDLKSGRCHRWPLCECCPLLLMIGGDWRHSHAPHCVFFSNPRALATPDALKKRPRQVTTGATSRTPLVPAR